MYVHVCVYVDIYMRVYIAYTHILYTTDVHVIYVRMQIYKLGQSN